MSEETISEEMNIKPLVGRSNTQLDLPEMSEVQRMESMSIRVKPEVYRKVKAISKLSGAKVSEVIRKVICDEKIDRLLDHYKSNLP